MFIFKAKRIIVRGLKSLWLHKLRSGLTMLGITFGVCSVIVMLAIGEGASEEAQRQIAKLGSNNIIVQSVEPGQDDSGTGIRKRINEYGLTFADAETIRDTLPEDKIIVQARRIRRRVWAADRRFETDVVGTVPWYAEVSNAQLVAGRFITTIDMHSRTNVCVLGQRAAEVLFPLGDALGSKVKVDRLRYRVVGILSSFARGQVGGKKLRGDPNSEVYIPQTTMKSHFGTTIMNRDTGSRTIERIELHDLTVQVKDRHRVLPVSNAIGTILKRNHKKKDYEIVVPLQLLQQARETQRIFNIVLGSIAAISLLVGGIGIMNITLATVMERTREIGIRRAMGAKRKDIVMQFLSETVLLALFGGGLGIALGVAVPYFVAHFANMATVITAWSLILAFSISASVGLIFGIYPAYRAANMDPIQALRHE